MTPLKRLRISVPLIGAMSWPVFQVLTVSLPLVYIVLVWVYVLDVPWPPEIGLKAGLVTLVSIVASLLFASVLLRALQRAYDSLAEAVSTAEEHAQQLNALHEASVAMTQDLDLDTVLGRVVDLSRSVIRARYAALQVLSEDLAQGHGHGFLTSGMTPEEVAAIGQPPKGLGVLGVVAQSEGPVRLDDLTRHPDAVGFPPHHPVMRTFLGTPVRFRDRLLGYIYLTEKEGGQPFTERDEETLERFAAQAGAVIANASLLREVRRLASAAERERIGRDLHDGTLQELYAIALGLQAALVGSDGDESGAASERSSERVAIERAIEAIRKVMAEIRHYVFDEELRAAPEQVALAPRLEAVAGALKAAPGMLLKVDLTGLGNVRLSKERVESLVQVVREALSNALRHSGGHTVELGADVEDNMIRITVRDDGTGFDAERSTRTGHGLSNMRVRVEALGGRLHIASHPEPGAHGTVLTVTVPTSLHHDAV